MKNLEPQESIALLQENYLGHLAFIVNDEAFTIPITYYYHSEGNAIIGYSQPGHKIDAMRNHPTVSFQVEDVKSANNWKSVLVQGSFEEIQGTEAKFLLHKFAEGVKSIINQKENKNPQSISEFTSDIFTSGVTIVYLIKVLEMTGKQMEKENE